MMTYQNAELEIVKFSAEDVLATSATTAAPSNALPEDNEGFDE